MEVRKLEVVEGDEGKFNCASTKFTIDIILILHSISYAVPLALLLEIAAPDAGAIVAPVPAGPVEVVPVVPIPTSVVLIATAPNPSVVDASITAAPILDVVPVAPIVAPHVSHPISLGADSRDVHLFVSFLH